MKRRALVESPIPWVGLVLVTAVIGAVEPRVMMLPLGLLLLVTTWRWKERALECAVIAALVVRPALDLFSDSRDATASLALRPAPALGLSLLLLTAVFGIARLRAGQSLWPDVELRRAHYWLFAAYGVGVLSGALGYGFEGLQVGLREAMRVASTISVLLLVLWWVEDHPERYHLGWLYLILGTALPVCVAVYQLTTNSGYLETEGLNRLRGTFSHPNSLGPFLVPFILFALGGIPSASWLGRVTRVVFAFLLMAILLLTYSRTALLVLLAGAGILPFLFARRLGARALWKSLVGLGVLIALGWVLGGGLIRERFAGLSPERAVVEAVEGGPSENSFTWRLLNWAILVRLGLDKPAAGHGTGMTTVLNPLVNVDYGGKPFNAHNDFVRFFFESGALGLVCYVVFGVLLCRWALRRARAASLAAAPGAFAVAASLISLMFLTFGTPELSLQTAILFELYGMLALLTVVPAAEALVDARGRGVRAPAAGKIREPGIATHGGQFLEDLDA